jgi:hypothetical protein
LPAALVALLMLAGCAWWRGDGAPAQLVLGSQDQGCTLSPDVAGGECCLAHDSAYWVGGTEQDRFTDDAEMLACLALWGVPEEVATLYYDTVRRLGESHWHYTKVRTRGPRRD